jgi:N-acetylmuramoyl-L-alanine amidase CwlA
VISVADGFDLEIRMSYALFDDDTRLTRSFPTEQEVWAAAERAGLVEVSSDGTKTLDDHLEIRRCEATPDETTDPGSDFVLP